MKALIIAIGAFGLLGSAAVADEVVVHTPGVVVEHRAAAPDSTTTTSHTVQHGNGCTTHSVTHADNNTGNSVSHTRTNC